MKENHNILGMYNSCTLCPRKCRVNRINGEKGFCNETDCLRIASACLHHGEEPILSGTGGSGIVFFTGCTLQCGFCQNYQISSSQCGGTVSIEECAQIFLTLQLHGAENINLVTGTHFIPGIILALKLARRNGLTIPVLWNTSGYEEEESLALLAPYIDIWVPDIKTLQSSLSKSICHRIDYPDKAKKAIFFMQKHQRMRIENRLMKTGMIIRHLVLPNEVSSTKEVLSWYKQNFSSDTILSLMFQYIPLDHGISLKKGDFSGYVTKTEYEEVLEYLDELEIEDGFFQELIHKSEWIPDFTKENPFPSLHADPVWHYNKGFILSPSR